VKISLNWLLHILNDPNLIDEKIAQALTSQGLEVEFIDSVNRFIDVSLTPNRGDCFSHIGIARELSASSNFFDSYKYIENQLVSIDYDVDLEPHQGVQSFYTATLSNVSNNIDISKLGFIHQCLEGCGVRSISPIVDITNYIMMLTGQPIHAYDEALLDGPIQAKINSRVQDITLIDDKKYQINQSFLTIVDSSKIIGLAGIMGGLNSSVSKDTSSIVLESANFSPEFIRGRARSLGLHTEASLRFERLVDPKMTRFALEHAMYLLSDICGAKVKHATYSGQAINQTLVSLPINLINSLLGLSLDTAQIVSILSKLGFSVTPSDAGELSVTVPSWRNDIDIAEDLCEEIARMYGYDNIPINKKALGSLVTSTKNNPVDIIRDKLSAYGFSECVNLTLTSETIEDLINPDNIKIKLDNPITTDLSLMRSSIASTLLPRVAHNLNNVLMPINLFEIGTIFSNKEEKIIEHESIGIISVVPKRKYSTLKDQDIKNIINQMIKLASIEFTLENITYNQIDNELFVAKNGFQLSINGLIIGIVGKTSGKINKYFSINDESYYCELDLLALSSLSQTQCFNMFSRLAEVRRDLSLVVPPNLRFEQISDRIINAKILNLKDFYLFDLYESSKLNNTKKSMGLALILHQESSTLVDNDIDMAVEEVVNTLESAFGITLRGS
jgi:phenylalanyl-tRNA synthetase beta chain